DFIADLEGDLAAQDIAHLVAVVMEVERALCPGGYGLLEQHDAVAGRLAQQLEHARPLRRVGRHEALSRLYADALHGARDDLRPWLKQEPVRLMPGCARPAGGRRHRDR